MMKIAMRWALSGILLCALGCAGLFQGMMEKPKVALSHVWARDTTLLGTTLIFVLNVENPNRKPIEVEEVRYKVFIGEQEFASAKTEKAIKVPARQTAQVEVPLPIQFVSLLKNVDQIWREKKVAYRIEGQAQLSFISIPFSDQGSVELQ
ncbi:MAG: LEA type 2 family protein [Bdellovibrio sp.]